MTFDIMTLFPDMCNSVLSESIIGRAIKSNVITAQCINIRDFAGNKHNRVDDTPYGGGMGMVMQAEPIYQCFRHICSVRKCVPHLIYMSPKGAVFTQQKARELARLDNIAILCGHYEGVDQRVLELLEPEEISVGDYVLTGGELPALTVIDAVARMCPGVLPNEEAFSEESFFDGLLEYPHYTRPEQWQGMSVPDVLISGHHKNIDDWRRQKSLELTRRLRPDLLKEK